ncbi:hypothetical protein PRZ48_000997 [Zasmidium cellare]|uniref:RING-type domain-containing protein n=1 Tax=Zasmidium cellare TaxID=395010 RepID=A0ABR0F0K7_ZASCE|nr:hypothetical protein PRZ48_000997 [Zasmidium cellare]
MPPIRNSSNRQANRANPLTSQDNAVTFDCIACMESRTGTPTTIHGHTLCDACVVDGIVPPFEAALKDETQYPVRYAGQAVDITTVSRFFSRQFLADWAVKTREYDIDIKDRLYCGGACGKYLGLKDRHRSSKLCSDCGSRTCADCAGAITSEIDKHVCKTDDTDPFAGLQRGRDYQICPGDGVPIELAEACNHITCTQCGVEFCFICGLPAKSGDHHWDYGMPCPQYNHPDNNPRFAGGAVDAAVRNFIQDAMDVAFMDGFAAANDPRELRLRNQDRQTLNDIGHDALARMLLAGIDETDGHPVEFSRVSLATAALTGALDVYALHLEPDGDLRRQRLNQIQAVHPTIARWMEQTQELAARRYPQLLEIYQMYRTAFRARILQVD